MKSSPASIPDFRARTTASARCRRQRKVASIPSALPEQRDGLRGEPLAAAGEAETVGRRRADVDPFRLDAERAGEPIAHLTSPRGDPGLLPDQDAIGVDELVAGSLHLSVGPREEPERLDSL